MKKILFVHGGADFHPGEGAAKVLTELLKADGRFECEATADLDAFARLSTGGYEAVVVYTTGYRDQLTPERERGLLGFIKNGGGFVGVHSAADSFRGNRAYVEMLGGEFKTHPEFHDFTVSVVDKSHYITTRVPDFTISDELYILQSHDPSTVNLLARTPWQGKQMPMVWTKNYGKGKVVYLANGHDLRAWTNPEMRKLLVRSISWCAGARKPEGKIRCGLLGYGPAFGMGKGHAGWINATEGMETVAVCDADPKRLEVARSEVPGLKGYFTDVGELLAMRELDLVVVILPHNLHASMAVRCMEAGKHVVVEKPFCITVEEATRMVDTARKTGRTLSVFHNRRWDGDYVTIKDIVRRGLIGEIFHIESFIGGYHHPGFWWRSDKEVSGGVMHDWGAHFIDWVLNLVPSRIKQVTGDFQKRVWHAVTNDDHGQAYIRFENGVTADVMISTIAASRRPHWRILGTKGSIEKRAGEELEVASLAQGILQESRIKVTLPGYGTTEFYRNVADHILFGDELAVKPEEARRVIAVIDAAQRSSASGASVPVAQGCE